jgi:hypothetical protein
MKLKIGFHDYTEEYTVEDTERSSDVATRFQNHRIVLLPGSNDHEPEGGQSTTEPSPTT